MQVDVRMLGQEGVDEIGLVRREVVQDDMDLPALRRLG